MANNKKVWMANLICILLLLAGVYGATLFVPCGFLCLTLIMWIYWIVMGCSLVFAVVNAVFYKQYKSRVAMGIFVFWALSFVILLGYYILLRYT